MNLTEKVKLVDELTNRVVREIERAFLEWEKLEAIRASHSAIIHSKEILEAK